MPKIKVKTYSHRVYEHDLRVMNKDALIISYDCTLFLLRVHWNFLAKSDDHTVIAQTLGV